jgi:hypothetical protein
MSLIDKDSKEAVEKNIKTEKQFGKPSKQALAIALQKARQANQKIGKHLKGIKSEKE